MSEPDSIVLFRRPVRGVQREALQKFAQRLSREVARGKPFTCLVSDDAELRRLNRRFLGKNRPTDVLSFPSSPELALPYGKSRWLGEIAISSERARKQAEQYGHSLEQEIGILMLHGLLHLLGMDHERDQGQMARAELRWRKKLGLPAGLTERVAS